MSTESKGFELDLENLDPVGGTIFTRGLIFERPDLFEQCPSEVQEIIKLMHKGETLFANNQTEESRICLEKAYELLLK